MPVPPQQPVTNPWMERLLQELSFDDEQVCFTSSCVATGCPESLTFVKLLVTAYMICLQHSFGMISFHKSAI